MSKRIRRVLTVSLSVEEFDLVAPLLAGEEFEVDRFPSAQGALELLAVHFIEVLLVRYPLPGMDLKAFLRAVRDESSPCLSSPLLLLANRKQLAAAESYLGRGANRVVCLDDEREVVQAVVSGLLDVAPRRECQLAQFKIRTDAGGEWVLCSPENASTTGVLIETDQQLPTGTLVDFELMVVEVPWPIVGRGEVTRHTLEGRDRVRGMGLRFLSFEGDSARLYQEFLKDTT